MKYTSNITIKLITTSILALTLIITAPACRRVADNITKVEQLPDDYPMQAKDIITQTARYLPKNADFVLFFASYGALTELIANIKQWGLFNPDELDALFNDLEIHNGLNPASLKSWHDAGFDARGGFLLSSFQNSPYAIFRIADRQKFDAFWDNFVTEEFGRPRTQNSKIATNNAVQINVLKKDLATIVQLDENTIIIVAGPEMTSNDETPDFLEAAKNLLSQQEKIAAAPAFLDFTKNSAELPIAAYLQTAENTLTKKIPQKYRILLADSAEALTLSANILPDKLLTQANIIINSEAENNTANIFKILKPEKFEPETMKKHLATKPGSALKISINTAELEEHLPDIAGENAAEKWNAIKDKLTIRLAGLNVQTQIIDNFTGTLLLQSYEFEPDLLRGLKKIEELLNVMALSLTMDFTHPETSDAYFNKINFVKKLIPTGLALIDNIDGILHADISYPKTTNTHIAYKNGTLAAATATAWPALRKHLAEPPQNTPLDPKFDPLFDPNNTIALVLDMQDIINILSIQYEAVSVQIANFLRPFNNIALTADTQNNNINLTFTATLNK